MFFVVLLYALLALTFPLSQFAVCYASPLFIITFRMIIAGILLISYQYFFKRESLYIKKNDIALFGITSIFHIFLAFVPEFWALRYLPSLKVNIMWSSTPLISAVFDYFLCNRILNIYKIFGIILGFVGILFIIFACPQTECLMEYKGFWLLPEIMLSISIISAAFAWFVVNKLNNKGYSCPMINGISMIGGGLLSWFTGLLINDPGICSVTNFNYFLIIVFGLILLSNIIVYNLFAFLLNKYSMTFISLAGFLSPVFGAIYAKFLFKQCLSWHYFVATVFIFLGLFIFYKKSDGN